LETSPSGELAIMKVKRSDILVNHSKTCTRFPIERALFNFLISSSLSRAFKATGNMRECGLNICHKKEWTV
jgi:hypothetical protein